MGSDNNLHITCLLDGQPGFPNKGNGSPACKQISAAFPQLKKKGKGKHFIKNLEDMDYGNPYVHESVIILSIPGMDI
jgi:hypothetical protein